MESQIAEAGDPWVDRYPNEVHHIAGVVYMVVRSPAPDKVMIHQLYAGGGYLAAWILCRSEAALAALERGQEPNRFDIVLEQTESVWFDVFDGEGFVVWSPNTETVANSVASARAGS
jgi:hypothetical protein